MINDAQVLELRNLLTSAQNILLALPSAVEIDHLASALALALSLKQNNKNVTVATLAEIKVSYSHLYGIGEVKNDLPASSNKGDLIITLGGVASPDGKITSVEKLDYFTIGSDWNLVFRTKPGQNFEPAFINPHRENKNFDLIFTLGLQNLGNLGALYTNRQNVFANSPLINITNETAETFAKVNWQENQTSSLSEMVAQLIKILNLPIERDLASNILSGIFSATANLEKASVSAETYEIVAWALKAGGKKPSLATGDTIPSVPPFSQPIQPLSQPTPAATLNKVFGANIFPNSPVSTPSPEEVPSQEQVITPEDDWLTPKIYTTKGSN